MGSLSFGVMREKTSEGESKRVIYYKVDVNPGSYGWEGFQPDPSKRPCGGCPMLHIQWDD